MILLDVYFKEPRKALVVKSMTISNTPGDPNPLGKMLSRSVTRYPAAAALFTGNAYYTRRKLLPQFQKAPRRSSAILPVYKGRPGVIL